MRIYTQFKTPNIIVSEVVHALIQPADWIDAICKAYYAGLLTNHAHVLLYGIGSKGGTNWAIGTVMEIEKSCYIDSLIACRHFTSIFNKQKRNWGHSTRKNSFALTRFEEVVPIMEYFGIEPVFNDLCTEIFRFDATHNLASEVHEADCIHDYENRSILKTINLSEHEATIREQVTKNILQEEAVQNFLKLYPLNNPGTILRHTFEEGKKGWALGETDVTILQRNGSLWDQYIKKVA